MGRDVFRRIEPELKISAQLHREPISADAEEKLT